MIKHYHSCFIFRAGYSWIKYKHTLNMNNNKTAGAFKYICLYFIQVLYSISFPKSLSHYMTIMAIIYYKKVA